MKREDKFVFSHRPYAVDLGSLTLTRYDRDNPNTLRGAHFWFAELSAVWFRGRKDAPVAVAGSVRGHMDEEPRDGLHALELLDDGRYGGNAYARWNGDNLWAPMLSWEDAKDYLEILRPMLDAFPEHPGEPYADGWWVY